jgi:mRNA interferase YafQ
MRTIERSTSFKRDYRRIRSAPRHRDLGILLGRVLEMLVADLALPASHRDHALTGDWIHYRECHLRPDLLLIYAKPWPDVLRLVRLGSHSDLFR